MNGDMKKLLCLVSLIWTVAADAPTLDERNRIVQLHTQVRESVEPTASNMMLMSYSTELESLAQQYIVNCSSAPPDPDFLPENVSEIPFISRGVKLTFDEVLKEFVSEKQFYDYENNTCTRACFGYKQMVTAKTTAVGCTERQCYNKTADSEAMYFTMCLYKPADKLLDERPYKSGTSCSECPKGYICRNKQCFFNSSLRNTISRAFWLIVISNLVFLSVSSTA
uniref:SCP domain-containing protein n=2 Tax=Mesocestoides corti TaxID=53468 RepID=A0A5K3FXW6_MESCO